MFWLLPAAASTYIVHTVRRGDDVQVVPELFGVDGAVYIRDLGSADLARLRDPEGELVEVEVHTLDRAVRMRPLQPVSPGTYQVELLTYYNADGTLTRLQRQGRPVGMAYAVWVPIPLTVTAQISPEMPTAPGPITWDVRYGRLTGALDTPPARWTEWEVEGMGTVGLVRGNRITQDFASWIPSRTRARAVAVGPEGRRAPGPWTAIPKVRPARSVHRGSGAPGWRSVEHAPRSDGLAAQLPTCTPTAGPVLSRVEHPDGVLLTDSNGVLHAVSVETFSAVTVDGVRHEGYPMFDPPAVALVGSGDALTVFGGQPSKGFHVATGEQRLWTGDGPPPPDHLRFRGGTAVRERGWTVTVRGIESQRPGLAGTLLRRGDQLELHELAHGAWTVREVTCGPPTGPPESVPPALLRRYDVGVPGL